MTIQTVSLLRKNLVAITGALLLANAHAEVKAGDMFGDWAIECRKVEGEKENCVLTQTVVNQEKKQALVKFIVGRRKDEPFMTALVPLGINIPAGVSLGIDQAKAIPLTVQTCLPAGCVATSKLDAKQLKTLKSGEKLVVYFTMKPADKPVSINGSLKGIHEGMKAVNL